MTTYYDRYRDFPDNPDIVGYDPDNIVWDQLLFVPGNILQSAELNEIQSILYEAQRRLGDSFYDEGDIVEDAQMVVEEYDPTDEWVTSTAYTRNTFVYNTFNSQLRLFLCLKDHTSDPANEPGGSGSWATYWELKGLTFQFQNYAIVHAGKLYIKGRVRDVDATPDGEKLFLLGSGVEYVGVVEVETIITELDEPSLRDPAAGQPGYNSAGAHRRVLSYYWAWKSARRLTSTDTEGIYTIDAANNRMRIVTRTTDSTGAVQTAYYELSIPVGPYIISGQIAKAISDAVPNVTASVTTTWGLPTDHILAAEDVSGYPSGSGPAQYHCVDGGINGTAIWQETLTADIGTSVKYYGAENSFGYNAKTENGLHIVVEHNDDDGKIDIERITNSAYETIGFDNDLKLVPVHTLSEGQITVYNRPAAFSDVYKAMARRTFDESGNYTVRQFPATIVADEYDENKFKIQFGAGKAYVQGFEVETVGVRSITDTKARDFNTINSEDVSFLRDRPYINELSYGFVRNVIDTSQLALNGVLLWHTSLQKSGPDNGRYQALQPGANSIVQVLYKPSPAPAWDVTTQRFVTTGMGTVVYTEGVHYELVFNPTGYPVGPYIRWIGTPTPSGPSLNSTYYIAYTRSYDFEKGYRTMMERDDGTGIPEAVAITGEILSPSPVTITSVPVAAGNLGYAYDITAMKGGGEAPVAFNAEYADGPDVLSATTFMKLTWTGVEHATAYRIYGRCKAGTIGPTNVEAVSNPSGNDYYQLGLGTNADYIKARQIIDVSGFLAPYLDNNNTGIEVQAVEVNGPNLRIYVDSATILEPVSVGNITITSHPGRKFLTEIPITQVLDEVNFDPANPHLSTYWWNDYGSIPDGSSTITAPITNTTKYYDALDLEYVVPSQPAEIYDNATLLAQGTDFELWDGQTQKAFVKGHIHWLIDPATLTGPISAYNYYYWAKFGAAKVVGTVSELFTTTDDAYKLVLALDSNPITVEVSLTIAGSQYAYSIADQINAAFAASTAYGPEYNNIASVSDSLSIQITAPNAPGFEGVLSSIDIISVTNDAYAILGLTVGTYNGTSGEGDYLSADSYDPYSEIPTFDGDELRDFIDWRPNKLPFNAGYKSNNKPYVDAITLSSSYDVYYNYYVGRIDAVYLTDAGFFIAKKGSPDPDPKHPSFPPQFLQVLYVTIPPYVYSLSDIQFQYIDTKRFTMDDIRQLEQRVDVLEYYKTVDALNAEALDSDVGAYTKLGAFTDAFIGASKQDVSYSRLTDIITGQDNGYIPSPATVDNLVGVDGPNQQLRLPFTLSAVVPEINESLTTARILDRRNNRNVTPKTITLQFVDEIFSSQLLATGDIAVVPNIARFYGVMQLTPQSDNWVDTTEVPDLLVNFQGEHDNMALDAWSSTEWGSWETNWTGRNTRTNTTVATRTSTTAAGTTETTTRNVNAVTTTTQNQSREGIQKSIVPESITNSIGDRVVDVSIQPFMRMRDATTWGTDHPPIVFECYGMRPNVSANAVAPPDVEYGFTIIFDDVEVEVHPHPDDAPTPYKYVDDRTGDGNRFIKTDETGYTRGVFYVPVRTFNTGSHKLTIYEGFGSEYSTATARFESSGLLQTKQETFLTVEVLNLRADVVTDQRTLTSTQSTNTRTVTQRFTPAPPPPAPPIWMWIDPWFGSGRSGDGGGGGVDPVAQTFVVSDLDIFISKVEVFFSKKDQNNIPVIMELRGVTNGIPNSRVIATTVKQASDVNTSIDGTVPTPFFFNAPVFLTADTEYCFVLKSGSLDYRIFITELGEEDLLSGKRITKQPHSGVFLQSANARTWTPDQNKDIKFVIYKANFDISNEVIYDEVEFTPEMGLIHLNAETVEANDTAVNWYYRFTASEPWQGFENRTNVEFGTLHDKILLKAEFVGNGYSPMLGRERQIIYFTQYQALGNYISYDVTVDNEFTGLKFWLETNDISNVEVFYSIDQGDLWIPFAAPTPSTGVSDGFTEYAYEDFDVSFIENDAVGAAQQYAAISSTNCQLHYLPEPFSDAIGTVPPDTHIVFEILNKVTLAWDTVARRDTSAPTSNVGTIASFTSTSGFNAPATPNTVEYEITDGYVNFVPTNIANWGAYYSGQPARVSYPMDTGQHPLTNYRVRIRMKTANNAVTPKVKRLRTAVVQ